MRRFQIASLLVLFGVLFSSVGMAQDLAKIESERKELFRKVAPAVVFIGRKDSVGSGFFVSEDGLILTNQHVVSDDKSVRIVTFDGTKTTGRVVERHPKLDLALIQTNLKNTKSIPLADMSGLEVGDWVASVGHGLGGVWTFNTGLVSNIYPDGKAKPVFQTQIPLNPGNSGGPVFDRRGRAVGIVTAGITGAQAINFAIPVEVALATLDGLKSSCDCLVITAPKGAPIFIDGSMVGTGPELIISATRKTYDISVIVKGKRIEKSVAWPKSRAVVFE